MSYSQPDPIPLPYSEVVVPLPNLAAPWRRACSWLFDQVIVLGGIAFLVGYGSTLYEDAGNEVNWSLVMTVLSVIIVSYHIVPVALWGQTLGKKVMGTRVVKAEDLSRPGFGRAFRRWVPYFLLGIIPGIGSLLACGLLPLAGFIMLFVHESRQTPLDLVADTLVINAH